MRIADGLTGFIRQEARTRRVLEERIITEIMAEDFFVRRVQLPYFRDLREEFRAAQPQAPVATGNASKSRLLWLAIAIVIVICYSQSEPKQVAFSPPPALPKPVMINR